MSLSGVGSAREEETGVSSRQSGPLAIHPLRPHSASQRPVLSWSSWSTGTHHGCSVGSLASGVEGSTTFSWTLALRARAWAPNSRARLRQDWSSEMESWEGTWGHRHCRFCKLRTSLPTAHPQSSLLTLLCCGPLETVVLFVLLTGDGQTEELGSVGELGSAGGLGSAGELASAGKLGQESW